MRRLAWALTFTLASLSTLHAESDPVVAIYYHGDFLTGGLQISGGMQRVSAIAVGPHQILAVGDDAEILRRKQPGTALIDLHGAFAMPGFNDAHVHLAYAGQTRLSIDLTGCRSLAEMLARISAATTHVQAGQWLLGSGWDHTLWTDKKLPTRQDLDRVSQGHPALLDRIDGHISVANTAALTQAGIGDSTADPKGGQFDRDTAGHLTGIVRETVATGLIRAHIPPLPLALRKQALLLALEDAATHGVTSVQDNSDWENFIVFQELERDHQLPVRISEWLHFDDPVPLLIEHRASQPAADRMLRTGMLKALLDGSLGSRTAALAAPYSDDPGNSGLLRYDPVRLNSMSTERAAAGFQLGFHAIGDRAIAMALDAFAAAGSTAERRNRIEHSQVIDPQDIARYKTLGVIASMQPSHLLTDMHWAGARLGSERARYSYTWKDFLDAGVPLAFGTDYPVEPITPFRGIYSAITRSDEAGVQSYFPAFRLTLAQALLAYTQGSAYAEFAEDWKGKLQPGFVADFVVLDRDLTAIDVHQVLGTQVLKTVVDGKVVFSAKP